MTAIDHPPVVLRIKERTLERGIVLGEFLIGTSRIGVAYKRGDMWEVVGCKNARTAEDAAKFMIDRMARKARSDLDHAKDMMNDLKMHIERGKKA